MKIIKSKNEFETTNLGISLAKKCKGGEVFSLVGNLGSGKTTLSKGIAKGLGIKKSITSPTFVILNSYSIKNNKKIKELIHIDAYRLTKKNDLETIAFFDFLKQKNIVMVIEWGNKIKRYLPKRTKIIKLYSLENNIKKIVIS